jgi:DNA-directed RNA polymerase subunit RPC12/RpoP
MEVYRTGLGVNKKYKPDYYTIKCLHCGKTSNKLGLTPSCPKCPKCGSKIVELKVHKKTVYYG